MNVGIALLAAILWGLNYSIDEKVLAEHITPFTLLALQSAFSAVIFTILAWATQGKANLNLMLTNHSLLWMMIGSVITVALANWLIVVSIQNLNATLASIIELSYPIFTILFTWALFRENHLNTGVIIGGILIIAGACVIAISNK